MANPQTEDGHTKIANELLDHLATMHLSPNQWQVFIYIIRKTYGYHKKVDSIANSQIVKGTKLGKTVVSRAVHTLCEMQLISKNSKDIGIQKDWERWQKLAELSTNNKLAEPLTNETIVSNTANNEKLAKQSTKLAILSTELAKPLTKVSSPHVTQKIKDTCTKDTCTKETKTSETFEEYQNKLREKCQDIDFDHELEKFWLYWDSSDKKHTPVKPKLCLVNWMDKARENAESKGSDSETKSHDLHAGLGGPAGFVHRP